MKKEEQRERCEQCKLEGNTGVCDRKDCSNSPSKEGGKLEIIPSPRIDWCGACKKEHGYHCPLDVSPSPSWETEFDKKFTTNRNAHIGDAMVRLHVEETFIVSKRLSTSLKAFISTIEQKAQEGILQKLIKYYYKQRSYKDSPIDVVVEEFAEIESISLSPSKEASDV